MSDNKDSGRIRMYVYSSIMGIVSSFGFFMFTAWLSLTASNKADEHPVFFPISAMATWHYKRLYIFRRSPL